MFKIQRTAELSVFNSIKNRMNRNIQRQFRVQIKITSSGFIWIMYNRVEYVYEYCAEKKTHYVSLHNVLVVNENILDKKKSKEERRNHNASHTWTTIFRDWKKAFLTYTSDRNSILTQTRTHTPTKYNPNSRSKQEMKREKKNRQQQQQPYNKIRRKCSQNRMKN